MKFIKILLFAFVLSLTSYAHALMVSPGYLLFEGKDKNDKITVTNTGPTAKEYKISFVNYSQNKDGTFTTVTQESANNKFAEPLLFFGPKRLNLKPGESQTIRIQSQHYKPKYVSGEYRSHLLIQEQEPTLAVGQKKNESGEAVSFKIKALYGVTIPVVVRKGNLAASTQMVSVKYKEIVKNNAKVPGVFVSLKRTGSQSDRGDIIIYDGDKEVGKLVNISTYLTITDREVFVPLVEVVKQKDSGTPLFQSKLKGKTLRVVYTSKTDYGNRSVTEKSLKF